MWSELERMKGLARWQVATTTCTTAFLMLLAIGVLSSDVCEDDGCIAEWRLVGAAAALCVLNFLALLCARRRGPQLEQEDSTAVATAVPRYSQEERSSMM